MIGTLDSQVIEKFKEFQDKTGKYLGLKIKDVEFESKNLFDIVSLTNGSEFPSSYVKRTEVQGDIPLISAGTKVDIMGHIKTLKGNNVSFPNKHYVFNNTKNKWNEVTHYIGKDYYTLTADGVYGGTLILRKMTDFPNGFYTTNVCKVLDFIDENVFEKYFLYAYNMEKQKHKFGFATKANNDNLQKVYIPIPKDYNEKYKSIDIQKAIVKFLEFWKINYTDVFRQTVTHQKPILEKIKKALIPATLRYDKTMVNSFNEFVKSNNYKIKLEEIEFIETNIFQDEKYFKTDTPTLGFAQKDLVVNNNGYEVYSGKKISISKGSYQANKLIDASRENIKVSFATDGDASAGTNFIIHDKPFYVNATRMVLDFNENSYFKYFYYLLLDMKSKYEFNYSKKANMTNLPEVKIKLPKHSIVKSNDVQKIIVEFWEMILNNMDERFRKFDNIERLTDKIDEAFLYRTFSKIKWREE